MWFSKAILVALAVHLSACAHRDKGAVAPDLHIHCDSCATWNEAQPPFRIHGNTYYVGVRGLSSVLITSARGHVLLDGDLPQSAPLIEQNIRTLGFRLEDVRYILNSHAHYDHAGGIAALQRASGATVLVSPPSAAALETGQLQADDPQYGLGEAATSFPAVEGVRTIADGEVLRLGDHLVVAAHFTPGHTPGGTTWTWQSCEQNACVQVVYADSLNAVSADDYSFSAHPEMVAALRHSIAKVADLPCDILIPVHPEFAGIATKLERLRSGAEQNPFIDTQACRDYAEAARQRLQLRIGRETDGGQ